LFYAILYNDDFDLASVSKVGKKPYAWSYSVQPDTVWTAGDYVDVWTGEPVSKPFCPTYQATPPAYAIAQAKERVKKFKDFEKNNKPSAELLKLMKVPYDQIPSYMKADARVGE